MRHPLIAALLFILPLVACKPRVHAIAADLGGDVVVTMEVSALGGFQSDWNRWLTVSSREDGVTLELFEDTGRWRGSALYRHVDRDVYILNEGQGGCVFFHTEPLEFVARHCPKSDPVAQARAPMSHQFEGYVFVGLFFETDGEAEPPWLWYNPAERQSEPLMADPL